MLLHQEEILAIKDRLTRPSSWITSFPLPHDSLGVGERCFGQVVTQLYQLTGPIYHHAIGVFNACSRRLIYRFLTDTGNVYNIRGADFSHTTSQPSQWKVFIFHLRAPSGLTLFIQQLLIQLEREQTLNLTSGSLHSTSNGI
jgi:hypothetical protein